MLILSQDFSDGPGGLVRDRGPLWGSLPLSGGGRPESLPLFWSAEIRRSGSGLGLPTRTSKQAESEASCTLLVQSSAPQHLSAAFFGA